MAYRFRRALQRPGQFERCFIDLGSSSSILAWGHDPNRRVSAPSDLLFDEATGEVVAIGDEATPRYTRLTKARGKYSPSTKRAIGWSAREGRSTAEAWRHCRRVSGYVAALKKRAEVKLGGDPLLIDQAACAVPNDFDREAIEIVAHGIANGLFPGDPSARQKLLVLREGEAVAHYFAATHRTPGMWRRLEPNGADASDASALRPSTVVVIDVGAGTTDLTVVELQGNEIGEVRLSAGVPIAGAIFTASVIGCVFSNAIDLPKGSEARSLVAWRIEDWKADRPIDKSDVPFSVKGLNDPEPEWFAKELYHPTRKELIGLMGTGKYQVEPRLLPMPALEEARRRFLRVVHALLELVPWDKLLPEKTVVVATGNGIGLPLFRYGLYNFAKSKGVVCVEPSDPRRRKLVVEGLMCEPTSPRCLGELPRRSTGRILYIEPARKGAKLGVLASPELNGSEARLLVIEPTDPKVGYTLWESPIRLDPQWPDAPLVREQLQASGLLRRVSFSTVGTPTHLLFDPVSGRYTDPRLPRPKAATSRLEFVSQLPIDYLDQMEW